MAMRRAVAGAICAAALRASAGAVKQCGDATCVGGDEQNLMQIQSPRGVLTPPAGLGEQEPTPTDCHLSDDGCRLNRMPFGKWHHVYPGGATACLNSSQPYFFRVSRGSMSKVVMWFDSGGACLNQGMLLNGNCSLNPWITPGSGVLNQSDVRNPYHSYTVVRVSYCSGDAHIGNVTQKWGPGGEEVQLRGADNVESVLQWAKAQFPVLTDLVLGGSSSGSIGLQMWSGRIIDTLFPGLPKRRALVHLDSFAGVLFPVGLEAVASQIVAQVWGGCNNVALTEEARVACANGQFTFEAYLLETVRRLPDVDFSMINTKADWLQSLYSTVLNSLVGRGPVEPAEFYKELTLFLKRMAHEPNFHSYLMDGDRHTILHSQDLFAATPLGDSGGGVGTPLAKWLRSFSCPWHAAHPTPENVCEGREVNVTQAGDPVQPPDYCDPALVGVAVSH